MLLTTTAKRNAMPPLHRRFRAFAPLPSDRINSVLLLLLLQWNQCVQRQWVGQSMTLAVARGAVTTDRPACVASHRTCVMFAPQIFPCCPGCTSRPRCRPWTTAGIGASHQWRRAIEALEARAPPDGVATLVNSLQNRVKSITLCVILNAKNGK